MQQIDNSIIDKIRKLRALADTARGATEDEAMAAQQKMFELLAKHNLSLGELPTEEVSASDPVYGEMGERVNQTWKRTIGYGVAQLNFCKYLLWGGKPQIIGTRANIAATKTMTEYLCTTVERLANQAASRVESYQRRVYRNSFSQGCASRLYSRLKELERQARAGEMKASSPDSWLPALAGVYAAATKRNDAWFAQEYPGTKISKASGSRSISHGDGYRAGQSAGDGISLNRQVGNTRGYLN